MNKSICLLIGILAFSLMAQGAENAFGDAEMPSGKDVYEKTCSACHATGVAGAPKLGDQAAWGERVAKGKEDLYSHAINGFEGQSGTMPPKGGNPSLSDAEVKSAVDYMVGQSR